MPEQPRNWKGIVGIVGCLALGFLVGRITPPAPTIEDGLYFNGKRVDPAKLGVPLPGVPKAPDGGKKKPGELPAGELGPAAFVEVPERHIVKNKSGIDGRGVPISACIETVGNQLGYEEIFGFTDYTAKQPGGQWPAKVVRQLGSYADGLDFHNATDAGNWAEKTCEIFKRGNLPVLLVYAKLPNYSENVIAHAVVVTGYEEIPESKQNVFRGKHDHKLRFTYLDCNFPGKVFSVDANELDQLGNPTVCWIAPKSAKKFDPAKLMNLICLVDEKQSCPCGTACSCLVCTCYTHAAKPIVYRDDLAQLDSDDQLVVVGQRGGSQKPVEAFGIETLVQVLKDLKEALFGDKSKGLPGLRDDIANGMKDFYASLRTGVLVGGVSLLAFMVWVGLNVQRIADSQARRVG